MLTCLGVHSQDPMQVPKTHEGPPGAFTGAGIYSFKDVTNESVVALGPPKLPSCHNP